MKLIDKSALVAEIERRMKLRDDSYKKYHCLSDFIAFEELEYFRDEFLPTIEVKEVESMQENPCNGCANRKGCVTCENGELRETVQEEPVSERFAFKAIPRLLEMIEPTDRAKSYVAKLADAFDSEGYYTDAKIVRESLKIMNGEKVAMATMDEEPVSEKKCMYSKDNYTDEDRKVLCEGCEVECKYSKQSVDEAMAEIEEKAKAFTKAHKGESADEILSEMRGEEPVSEELESWDKFSHIDDAIEDYCCYDSHIVFFTESLNGEPLEEADDREQVESAFKAGAKWQKEQFEKNRLKHCNSITNEQAELEQGFIDQHLNKYQRIPTFLDAIEYGMRLQKQQMIDKACKWLDENIEKYISADGEWDINWCIMNDFRKSLEE